MALCGLFFLAGALGLVVTSLVSLEPGDLLWVVPVSLALGVGVFVALARWGALAFMQLVADSDDRIRVILGRPGVVRMAKRLGNRGQLARDVLLGILIVFAAAAIAILFAVMGAGREFVLGAFGLPLFWLWAVGAAVMIRTAFRIRSGDVPLASNAAAPLAAVYLRSGGTPAELTVGVPAEHMIAHADHSDLAEATALAKLLAQIRPIT